MADLGYFTAGVLSTPAIGPPVDLEFGVTDANGTWWLITGWTGMDGPDVVGQVVQKAGDHGGLATPQFFGSRPLTLIVQATAVSQAQRDVARAFVAQAFPVNDLATLRWDEPVPVQMGIRRTGRIAETYMTLIDVVFSVPLVAPDPRKYSTVLHSLTSNQAAGPAGLAPPLTPPFTLPAGAPPMSVACFNAGSFETRPLVTIQGPISGPAVVNQATGQTVSFSGLTLGATDQLVVDLNAQQATFNGAVRPADLFSSWWVLPQQTTTTVQVTGTGGTGSQMRVDWRDAWI